MPLNKKISELPNAVIINDSDVFPIVQTRGEGEMSTNKATIAELRNTLGGGAASIVDTTYSELKSWSTAGTLVPGQLYKFQFTSIYQDRGSSVIASSVGSQSYELIIKAVNTADFEDDVTLLMPDAHYDEHWLKAKYSFKQNDPRFDWARPDDKGQIYWMQDMYGNEADYDFIGVSTTFQKVKLTPYSSGNVYIAPSEYWYPGNADMNEIGNPNNVYGGDFYIEETGQTMKLHLFSDTLGNNRYLNSDIHAVKVSTFHSTPVRLLPQIAFLCDNTIRNCMLTQCEQAVFQTTTNIENLNLFNVKRVNIGAIGNGTKMKNIVVDGKGIVRDFFVSGGFENVTLNRIEKVLIGSACEGSTIDLKESYCKSIRRSEIRGSNVEMMNTIEVSSFKDIKEFAVQGSVVDVTIRSAVEVQIDGTIRETMIDHFQNVYNVSNISNMRAERILGFNGNGYSIHNADFAPGCQHFQLLSDIQYYTVCVGNGGTCSGGWVGLYGINVTIAPRTFENGSSKSFNAIQTTLPYWNSLGYSKLVYKIGSGAIQSKIIGQ